jgi:hypothetical protein
VSISTRIVGSRAECAKRPQAWAFPGAPLVAARRWAELAHSSRGANLTDIRNAICTVRLAQGAGIRDWLCKRAKSDPKATFEPQRNCPLPFLQRSLREQREPVLMTRSSIP